MHRVHFHGRVDAFLFYNQPSCRAENTWDDILTRVLSAHGMRWLDASLGLHLAFDFTRFDLIVHKEEQDAPEQGPADAHNSTHG
jgi:hypothetical protein